MQDSMLVSHRSIDPPNHQNGDASHSDTPIDQSPPSRRSKLSIVAVIAVAAAVIMATGFFYMYYHFKFAPNQSSPASQSDRFTEIQPNTSNLDVATMTDSLAAEQLATFQDVKCGYSFEYAKAIAMTAQPTPNCTASPYLIYKNYDRLYKSDQPKARYYLQDGGLAMTMKAIDGEGQSLNEYISSRSMTDAQAKQVASQAGIWLRSTLSPVTAQNSQGYRIWGSADSDFYTKHPIYLFELANKQILIIHDYNSPNQKEVSRILNSLKIDGKAVSGKVYSSASFNLISTTLNNQLEQDDTCYPMFNFYADLAVDNEGVLIYRFDIGNGGVSPTQSAIFNKAGSYATPPEQMIGYSSVAVDQDILWLEVYSPRRITSAEKAYQRVVQDASCRN